MTELSDTYSVSSFSEKLLSCCKKKKKKRNNNSLSELNYILSNKKDLLKLDSQTFSNKNPIFSPFRSYTCSGVNMTSPQSNLKQSVINSGGKMRLRQSNICRTATTKKPEKDDRKFFHEFKDKLRCFFCGGQGCKHENYINNLDNNNAIIGLNSNFITKDVIASQRPSEVLITRFHLLSTFKELNIGLIVNLQREGEHPYCGPNAYNLTSAGYSYNPSVFTGDDIKCKLSGWKDMAVPTSMNFMLDIVKEMSVTVRDLKKRVLVHCHAGYGRTGVVIACYLLYNSESDSETVIDFIRSKRHKCIETKDQRKYCRKFEEFLNHSRMLFDEKASIDVYLKKQEDILFGEESKQYGFIPKIITKTLEKISLLKQQYKLENMIIFKLIRGLLIDWNDELENVLNAMKNMLNKNNWELFDKTENLIILTELLFDWIEDCVENIISPERTSIILESDIYNEYANGNISRETKKTSNEIFSFIRKIYLCYEYEILYQFASFLTTMPPEGDEEKEVFNQMLDRLSLELLGFSFQEFNNDIEIMDSAKPLVNGLSQIIKLIFDSLSQENEELSAITPVRRNSSAAISRFRFSKSIQQTSINNTRQMKDTFVSNNKGNNSIYENAVSIGAFSSYRKGSESLSSSIVSPSFPVNAAKEKQLLQLYEELSKHFNKKNGEDSNKKETTSQKEINDNNEDSKNNIVLKPMIDKTVTTPFTQALNEIPDRKESEPEENSKEKDLTKVVEEISKQSPSSSFSSEKVSKDNSGVYSLKEVSVKDNKSKVASSQKSIINLNCQPIAFQKHNVCGKSSSVISFECFRKSIFDSQGSKFKNDSEQKVPSLFGKGKIEPAIQSQKGLEKRFFLGKNSSLLKIRKSRGSVQMKARNFGLDMKNCKDQSDKKLINLMKTMNSNMDFTSIKGMEKEDKLQSVVL